MPVKTGLEHLLELGLRAIDCTLSTPVYRNECPALQEDILDGIHRIRMRNGWIGDTVQIVHELSISGDEELSRWLKSAKQDECNLYLEGAMNTCAALEMAIVLAHA
jgi:hypothetical protein